MVLNLWTINTAVLMVSLDIKQAELSEYVKNLTPLFTAIFKIIVINKINTYLKVLRQY